jgi:hypothetical protein
MTLHKFTGLALAGLMLASPLAASAATVSHKAESPCKGLKGAKLKACKAQQKDMKAPKR